MGQSRLSPSTPPPSPLHPSLATSPLPRRPHAHRAARGTCPAPPAPQVYARPPAAMHAECRCPHATTATAATPPTRRGSAAACPGGVEGLIPPCLFEPPARRRSLSPSRRRLLPAPAAACSSPRGHCRCAATRPLHPARRGSRPDQAAASCSPRQQARHCCLLPRHRKMQGLAAFPTPPSRPPFRRGEGRGGTGLPPARLLGDRAAACSAAGGPGCHLEGCGLPPAACGLPPAAWCLLPVACCLVPGACCLPRGLMPDAAGGRGDADKAMPGGGRGGGRCLLVAEAQRPVDAGPESENLPHAA